MPLTSIDYPGELAAVVFTQGCPWRCVYCHNPELLPARGDTEIPWQQIVDFMHSRRGLLDALVFSGGEPTFQSALPQAIQQIRAMGFKIGLHSAGIYPRKLQALLSLIDWIGLDIKASKNDYPLITQTRDSGNAAWQSAELVINSGVSHQLRITAHPNWLADSDAQWIRQRLLDMGAESVVIQAGRLDHA
ncbi:anaerobic ribonucleoside-triphosphate reductase activating protein [Halopseudomonas sp. Lyrl_26]|uniref:anaerobic ribonucleoside-triphosphate reductase activating protein n=1 Tax=Halopseudomonas sp. Lyrl_26 TaxID=3110923 RepID=UPI003F814850